jgi:hypothetical protein
LLAAALRFNKSKRICCNEKSFRQDFFKKNSEIDMPFLEAKHMVEMLDEFQRSKSIGVAEYTLQWIRTLQTASKGKYNDD